MPLACRLMIQQIGILRLLNSLAGFQNHRDSRHRSMSAVNIAGMAESAFQGKWKLGEGASQRVGASLALLDIHLSSQATDNAGEGKRFEPGVPRKVKRLLSHIGGFLCTYCKPSQVSF